MRNLSIVIPIYNAAGTIGSLSGALLSLYAGNLRLQIVLVNDYSNDDTDIICRRLQEMHPETITYIRLAKNFGEHNAVMAGLHHVNGEYCVIMDDDFQNPPEEVQTLLDEIEKGYDVVFSRYARKKDHWLRNLGSWFNDRVATFLLRKPTTLYLSSFKIINRFLVDEIIKHTSPAPYIDGIILLSTSNIGSVTVHHAPRRAGESGYTFPMLLGLWGNMVVGYSMIPLRIAGLVGLCLTIAGVIMSSDALFEHLHSDIPNPTDFEKLTSMIILFRGLQLLAMGVVGEYVGRIYFTLNQSPQFVIRELLPQRTRKSHEPH